VTSTKEKDSLTPMPTDGQRRNGSTDNAVALINTTGRVSPDVRLGDSTNTAKRTGSKASDD